MSGELGALLQMPRSDSPGQDGEAAPAAAPEAAPRMDEAPRKAGPAAMASAPRMEFRLSGDRMGGWQKAWGTVHHLFQVGRRRFTDARAAEGGILAAALRWRGPSVEDQSAYARSRAWTPTGHAGGLMEAMGVIFHAILGRAAAAVGNAIKWVFCWPLHFTVTAVAGSAGWWGLHAALGLPGGTLPLIVTLILLGAWVLAGFALVLVADHRQGDPSRYGPPAGDGEAYPDDCDDGEDYRQ